MQRDTTIFKRESVTMGLFETPWKGWIFRDGILFDESGNKYTRQDITESWLAGEIVNDFEGTKSQVVSLKRELSHRLKLLKTPRITVKVEIAEKTIEKTIEL